MLTTLFKKKRQETMSALQHDSFFEELRASDYARLDENKQVYLDFTGGNLYAQRQIDHHYKELSSNAFGNPHSTNPTSQLATKKVEEARQKVLSFFNAQDYFCVFTANASGALKIVGECYPFDTNSKFVLLADNHNSVNGIREYAKGRGSAFEYVPVQYEDLRISEGELNRVLEEEVSGNKLFAFPAQSNVSGVKHSLDWIGKAQSKGWDVLLDAAAFVPSSPLDLSKVTPDFVSISFYKIFGYPTGLGCLLIRKEKFNLLQKKWFAGGTVTLAGVKSPSHYLIENHERYENGTIDYLGIPALSIGLDFIESIGIQRINERVNSITTHMCVSLRKLQHSNGQPLVNMFGPGDRTETGGTLIMTFNNPDGTVIPFEDVERLTNARNISIRSGCFCNPGLDEINNCLTTEELAEYFTSRHKGDYYDMIATLKKMRGAVRVSFGIATVQRDLDAFLEFAGSLVDRSH
ncbi:MAG: aminotransferase class V-fold PLP-dependent enzyme [bacterium]|nr:aminotransferase class V-fold PLP-dependent enzyme [bacterium]